MNSKKAKQLRKMAHQMALQQDGSMWTDRQLMVHPAHERQVREGDRPMGRATAVNKKESVRGVYKWLKKELA